jgi:hypothetical protein
MTYVIRLNLKYSKRIRSMFRRTWLPFLHQESTSTLEYIWSQGHCRKTDKLINRLIAIGMVKIAESF